VVPQGLGTALKPAFEPIILARKPLIGTVAANVAAHGTGALNIDGCRIGFAGDADESEAKDKNRHADFGSGPRENAVFGADNRDRGASGNYDAPGRWPANLVLDEDAAAALDEQSGERPGAASNGSRGAGMLGTSTFAIHDRPQAAGRGDTGGASRFFYCAKASRAEREAGLDGPKIAHGMSGGAQGAIARGDEAPNNHGIGLNGVVHVRNHHPTVKPVALMRWLVRLVTPAGGLVLDPFCGSGTTGVACVLEGRNFLGIEREPAYADIARRRIAEAQAQGVLL
jgi:hypothetical protein